jgi:hypothetical protein
MRFNQCKRLQIEPGCKSWVARFIQLASGTCKLVPIASWERNTRISHHDIFQTVQKKQPLERASRKTQSSKILKCKEIMYTRPFNSASNKTRSAANAAPERKKNTKCRSPWFCITSMQSCHQPDHHLWIDAGTAKRTTTYTKTKKQKKSKMKGEMKRKNLKKKEELLGEEIS